MIKNLSFDFAKGGSKKEQLTERKYKTLTTLLSADFSKTELPKKTILFMERELLEGSYTEK